MKVLSGAALLQAQSLKAGEIILQASIYCSETITLMGKNIQANKMPKASRRHWAGMLIEYPD